MLNVSQGEIYSMNNDMYEDEREIDIKQGLLYLWDHVGIIILVGIVFAALLGGYKVFDMNKPLNSTEVLGSIIEQNKAAANPAAGVYNYYTDREVIEGTCVVRSQISIDYSFDNVIVSDNMDYNGLWGRFQIDATNTLNRSDVLNAIVNEVNAKHYDDIELNAEQLKYMIYPYFGGANVAYISVTDVNKDRALDIANMLGKYFVQNASEMENVKSVELVGSPVFAYDTTEEVAEFSIVDLIKFVIIGGVVGVVLACGLYFVLFILKDAVRTSDDVEYARVSTFVRIPSKKDRKEAEYKRAAYKISLLENCNRILMVPVDTKTEIKELCDKVAEELKSVKSDTKLIQTDDIISSPDALLEAKSSDAVLLVSTYGVTSVKELAYARDEISKTGTEILGVVIDNCKH